MASKPAQRLRLSDVTVCAADSVSPALAARALEICVGQCEFGDAILFSDTPVTGNFRHVQIERMKSLDEYSRFCLRDIPRLTNTPFVLIVQWDGYIVDPGMWSGAFRNYDYVGAPIPEQDGTAWVGNGGFSLRSRRLLDALPGLEQPTGVAEDVVICRRNRERLEGEHQVKFAPVALATRFSYEMRHPGRPTFGFHGAPNLWRHSTDAEILRMVETMPPRALASYPTHGLIVQCHLQGREALALALYRRARTEVSVDEMTSRMTQRVPRPLVTSIIASLEAQGPG
jgi:hypothetical protein